MFTDASYHDIDRCLQESRMAFTWFRQCTAERRKALLYAIAKEIETLGDNLINIAHQETRLPHSRLRAERIRTLTQLTNYADFIAQGRHLDLRMEIAGNNQTDLRKMNIPLGPVVVFGSSNFPFAYSTAGGDTASALAAGCTVIVKAHPAHARTSQLVSDAISRAIKSLNMPDGIFTHLHGVSNMVGEALVKHPFTKAVAFTGSYEGGKQLFDWGTQRPEPIPVFAEMGSINPVYLFPEKLQSDPESIADQLAASVCLGAGQFCTSPGILVALQHPSTENFAERLTKKLDQQEGQSMLHEGIYQRFIEKRDRCLNQEDIERLTQLKTSELQNNPIPDPAYPTLVKVNAGSFLSNPVLYQEVFGPFAILVICSDIDEMKQVIASMPGQLTSSIIGTTEECMRYHDCVEEIMQHAGRIVFNGVPTGVEVSIAMHHGGPFPATTDARFTAVGPDAIRRFVRPVCFQNWPDSLLPECLQKEYSIQSRK